MAMRPHEDLFSFKARHNLTKCLGVNSIEFNNLNNEKSFV